jgi:hypothetical protein
VKQALIMLEEAHEFTIKTVIRSNHFDRFRSW